MLLPRPTWMIGLMAAAMLAAATSRAEESPSARWESSIAKFEQQDLAAPPAKHGIVFIGSSSIVGWDLTKWFSDLPAINRGFGGSEIADSVHFADRILLPYQPRTVVLYAGDNDLSKGKTPQQVLSDWKAFVNKVHEPLPETKIIFVAIKPSIQRWRLIEKVREANRLIAADCAANERLAFLDIEQPMLGDDGKPRKELFKDDGLHLNEAGYQLWSQLLRPLLAP